VIYAETQLREVALKHEDVEQLFRKEEEEWNQKFARTSAAKADKSEALDQIKSQLNALVVNYDVLRGEAKELKEQGRNSPNLSKVLSNVSRPVSKSRV
jgi:hypothetical protein